MLTNGSSAGIYLYIIFGPVKKNVFKFWHENIMNYYYQQIFRIFFFL